MFFTAEHWPSGRQCVGVAVASNPEGPYDSPAAKPLVCPLDDGGAIDASVFVDDDNTAYLLYKTDGNCCGKPTRIELVRLSADGTALAGTARELIRQTQQWEGNLVEAPTLLKRDGRYVLLYSANDYAGAQYAIGYATAAAVAGPYTKADGPFLSTDGSGLTWLGPGGQDVAIAPDGTDRMVFHSWDSAVRYRGINVAPLSWQDGVPRLAHPGRDPRP
jgi:beta-xylosidase